MNSSRLNSSAYPLAVVLLMSGLACAPVWAAPFTYDYNVFTSVAYSNNLAQLPTEVGGVELSNESGKTTSYGIAFNGRTLPGQIISGDISGRFARNDYSLDELTSDDEKSLNASLLLRPKNSNFSLGVYESLQQVALDRESRRSVNNTRDVNTFTVVPSYFVLITPSARLDASYEYTKLKDDEAETSRDVKTTTLSGTRIVSNAVSWSLNVQESDTEYTDFSDAYEQQELFFGIQYGTALTRWQLEFGRQRAQRTDIETEYVYQNSLRFSVDREINSVSSLVASYQKGFGDVLTSDLTNSFVGVAASDQSAYIEGIAKEHQLSFSYRYTKRTFSATAAITGRQLEDVRELVSDSNIDEKRYGFSAGASYRFLSSNGDPSSLSLGVGYRFNKDKFNLTDQTGKENQYSLTASYFHSPLLRVFLEGGVRDVSGDAARNNFDEKRLILGIDFTPRGRRR